MTTTTLDDVPGGSRVFIDTGVFIYFFLHQSEQCRRLLERCERGEVLGASSVVALLEATHKLMVAEAVRAGHVPVAGAIRRLRDRRAVAASLTGYRDQVECIPQWGIQVLSLDLACCLRAADIRVESGLLTNDSVLVATMRDAGIEAIATADSDFDRVKGLRVYRPTDLDLRV